MFSEDREQHHPDQGKIAGLTIARMSSFGGKADIPNRFAHVR
jgi:hypothetical protein